MYDAPGTLFYLDPPYWIDGEKFYKHDFKPEDHQALADVVKKIKGKVVISYNDRKELRRLYKGFKIQTTEPVRYSLNNLRAEPRKKSELLITNF